MTRALALLLIVGCGDKDTSADADGDGYIADDCDNNDASVYPDADELCDGVDNNCDGQTDEATAIDATVWHPDVDGDGYGDEQVPLTACDQPSGFITDGTDCNDGRDDIHPDADELCDGLDNDCDGEADGDNVVGADVWYPDADGDGYGDSDAGVSECHQPSNYLSDGSDCDDSDAATNPDATEVCDGEDNDCDGTTDEDTADITEYCDGVDNNCDGTIDEETAVDVQIWYADTDGDGRGDDDNFLTACDQPKGYVLDDSDCDDSDPTDESCICTLDSVGSATTYVQAGSVYGQWMADPEETLGSGLYWEMDSYYGYTLVEYPSLADLTARSNGSSTTMSTQYEGTGATVYDGYVYYVEYNSNTVIKYDIDQQKEVGTLTLTGAGYHNTYYYQWGGYSDIDLAVDENGLWAIYATSSNSGKFVISKIDADKFTIIDTWNTDSSTKNSYGNAFIICGVFYATNSYSSSSATISYAYDTNDSTSSNPAISFPVTYGYVTQIDYNPTDGLLYVWDYSRRVTFPTTVSN